MASHAYGPSSYSGTFPTHSCPANAHLPRVLNDGHACISTTLQLIGSGRHGGEWLSRWPCCLTLVRPAQSHSPPLRFMCVESSSKTDGIASVQHVRRLSRRALFAKLRPLISDECPFVNLLEPGPGRWGAGLTAAKTENCLWLRPESVGQFRFLETAPKDHLRHVSFVVSERIRLPWTLRRR